MKRELQKTREAIIEELSAFSRDNAVRPRYENQIEAVVPASGNVPFLSFCRTAGFAHLSNIACVDMIDDGEFEVMYNLWSYKHKLHCTVKVRADREGPLLDTAMNLWPQAQVYEQEIHEFFGVVFRGNPDLSPLFLHNWKDKPPMRKDFDSEEYSRKAYGFLDGTGDPKRGAS